MVDVNVYDVPETPALIEKKRNGSRNGGTELITHSHFNISQGKGVDVCRAACRQNM